MTHDGPAKLFGGIEAGGTKFICRIVDWDGTVLRTERIPTRTPTETLPSVARFFRNAAAELGSVAALSVGSFGPLALRPTATDFGSITSTPKPGWSNINLLTHFRDELSVPVLLDTDVNCAALGEHMFGSARGLDTFCYVTVGTGIGVGMIVNGLPYGGANHPEVGHIRVPRVPGDDVFQGCCPFHGDCLEGLACGPAIKARWGLSPTELPDCHPAWAIEADYIAALCANLSYIMRPERIIIGGGVMQRRHLYSLIRDSLSDKLAGYDASLRDIDLETYIAEPTSGDSAGVSGALMLAYRHVEKDWPKHWRTGAHPTGNTEQSLEFEEGAHG
jgi:fructokinase